MNTDFSVLMTTGKDPQKESEKIKSSNVQLK